LLPLLVHAYGVVDFVSFDIGCFFSKESSFLPLFRDFFFLPAPHLPQPFSWFRLFKSRRTRVLPSCVIFFFFSLSCQGGGTLSLLSFLS